MTENEISYAIIGAAIELHSKLGPGLLESVYEHALAYDLRKLGFMVEQQVPIPLIYKEVKLDYPRSCIRFRYEKKKIKKDGCSRNIFPAIIVATMVRKKI